MKPDLDNHSLIRFLDKFVYKSPKTTDSSRGVSIMQPLKSTKDLGDIWLGSRGAGTVPKAVNSASFKNKKSEDVAAEDAFFHKYFQHMAKEPKKPAKKSGDGEGTDDEEEDEIWKALVSTHPDIDGDDAGSEGFDDLDEDEMASDGDESPALDLDESDDDYDDMSEVDIEGTDDEEGDAASDGLVAVDEDEDGFDVKDKKEEKDKRKARRKQLKDLPMFASVDDYAELLGQEQDEDFGT